MELICKIGTQGLPDGRSISMGDTYEVDDATASTLIAAGYAEAVSIPIPVAEPDIVDIPVVAERLADLEPDSPMEGGEPDTLPDSSTGETESLADSDSPPESATTDGEVPEPDSSTNETETETLADTDPESTVDDVEVPESPKKKRVYKRRA